MLPYVPAVKVVQDCFGQSVRLTDDRLAHILEHAEMAGMENELERVLLRPAEVGGHAHMRTLDFSMSFMRALELVGNGCAWW